MKKNETYQLLKNLFIRFLWNFSIAIFFTIVIVAFLKGAEIYKYKAFIFGNLDASEYVGSNADTDVAEESNQEAVINITPEKEPESKQESKSVSEKEQKEIEFALNDLRKRYPSRNYIYWKTVKCKLTAYTPDAISCGQYADGFTAKMDDAYRFDGVAASPDVIPYRTGVYIPEIGIKEVDDTGGAMRQAAKNGIYHIDVRMKNNKDARKFGVQWRKVHLFKTIKNY